LENGGSYSSTGIFYKFYSGSGKIEAPTAAPAYFTNFTVGV